MSRRPKKRLARDRFGIEESVAVVLAAWLGLSVVLHGMLLEGITDTDEGPERLARGPKQSRVSRPRPDYKESAWFKMLQDDELRDRSSDAAKQFRDRFRMPHEIFVTMTALASKWFPIGDTDAAGRHNIPIEMKVLAVLQILGRGTVLDDISQLSGMSTTSAQQFLHAFCARFAKELWTKWVKMPTDDRLQEVMGVYKALGYPGAMGSMDCTHVHWGCCPISTQCLYTGKEKRPTVVFEVIVDHARGVLAATKSYPGSFNKSIVRVDKAVASIRQDKPYVSQTFTLFKRDRTPTVHRGAYLLMDGGYHKWETLICPDKHPLDKEEALWSMRLESVRKDSECFFGTLKARFQIFRAPVMFRDGNHIDNIFFTCCILHNMLLCYDGLDQLETNVKWAGADGSPECEGSRFTVPWDKDDAAIARSSHVEVESSFPSRTRALIDHFIYRASQRELAWTHVK